MFLKLIFCHKYIRVYIFMLEKYQCNASLHWNIYEYLWSYDAAGKTGYVLHLEDNEHLKIHVLVLGLQIMCLDLLFVFQT